MSVKKYFLAIVIPPPLQQEIEAVKTELETRHGLRGALRSPAHITLHRPFEWKEEKEDMLTGKLKTFRNNRQFDVALNGFDAFVPRVIYVNVLQNAALYDLHADLKKFAQQELKLLNEINDLRGFHPHVTVAFRDLRKSRFATVWDELRQRTIKGEFSYRGFSLLKLEDKWRERCFFEGD